MLAIFAVPAVLLGAGMLGSGALWGYSISKEERQAREAILLQCLSDKGYKAYMAQKS